MPFGKKKQEEPPKQEYTPEFIKPESQKKSDTRVVGEQAHDDHLHLYGLLDSNITLAIDEQNTIHHTVTIVFPGLARDDLQRLLSLMRKGEIVACFHEDIR